MRFGIRARPEAGADPGFVQLRILLPFEGYQCQAWMFQVGPSDVGLFEAAAPFRAFL
jgi:hypothetical protein